MSKRPAGGTRPAGSYSPGIVAEGRFVYVSGQGPFREGEIVGLTAGEQTRVVLENVAAVLAEAGASLSDVVRPLPARTTVGAVLPRPGMRVEIDCVAVLPDRQGEQ